MKVLNIIGLTLVVLLAVTGTTLGVVEHKRVNDLSRQLAAAQSQEQKDAQEAGDTAEDVQDLTTKVTGLTGSNTPNQVKSLGEDVKDLEKSVKDLKKVCADKPISNLVSSLQGSANTANNAGTYYYDRMNDVNIICGTGDAFGSD